MLLPPLPQVPTREFSLDNPRSSHCPAIRPGPALGCNFCWNTIDAHGRILRRKTKYHCPECQTNLCIVPCFQEYHERQANETATSTAGTSSSTTPTTATTTMAATTSGGGGGNSPITAPSVGSRGTSPGKGDKAVDGGSLKSSSNTKPSLKLASFGALSASSTSSSSPSLLDSGGSQTASLTPQQPPDFTRGSSQQQ